MKGARRAAILLAGALAVGLGVLAVRRPGPGSNPSRPAQTLAGRKISVLTNQPHTRASEALGDWFHKETGAVVQNVVVDYAGMRDYVLRDVASPEPRLDVVMFCYVDIGALVEHGALADLTAFIERHRDTIRPDDFIGSLYDPYTLYKGRRWSLPYDGDTHILFYRKSILARHGLTPPATWDEYLHVARTVTEKEKANGIYGTAIMTPSVPMIAVSSFMNRLGGYGGRLLDRDGRPVVNSPQAVRALAAMVEQGRYALPTPLETNWEVSRDAFLSGRVAMVEQWTDIGVMSEDASQSVIQGDWGAVQMPRGAGAEAGHVPALNAGFSLGVSSRAPDPEAARAYLLFASRPDITLRLNLINGGIDPTRVSVLTSPEYRAFAPELSKAAQSAIQGAAAWPTLPEASRLLAVLTRNLTMAMEERQTPREALDRTQKRWREILGP